MQVSRLQQRQFACVPSATRTAGVVMRDRLVLHNPREQREGGCGGRACTCGRAGGAGG